MTRAGCGVTIGAVFEVGAGAAEGTGVDGWVVTMTAASFDGLVETSAEVSADGLAEVVSGDALSDGDALDTGGFDAEVFGDASFVFVLQPVKPASARDAMRMTASRVPVHLLFLKLPIMIILLLTLVLFFDIPAVTGMKLDSENSRMSFNIVPPYCWRSSGFKFFSTAASQAISQSSRIL